MPKKQPQAESPEIKSDQADLGTDQEMQSDSISKIPIRPSEPKPTQWIDSFQINMRTDLDQILLIGRAIDPSPQPPEYYEICRLLISRYHAVNIINSLARTINYYPERTEQSQLNSDSVGNKKNKT